MKICENILTGENGLPKVFCRIIGIRLFLRFATNIVNVAKKEHDSMKHNLGFSKPCLERSSTSQFFALRFGHGKFVWGVLGAKALVSCLAFSLVNSLF